MAKGIFPIRAKSVVAELASSVYVNWLSSSRLVSGSGSGTTEAGHIQVNGAFGSGYALVKTDHVQRPAL